MKKLTTRLLALTLALSLLLSGCSKPDPREDFDTFLSALPGEMISGDSMDLNFLFENPEKFGIEPALQTLPFLSEEDAKEGREDTKKLLDRLSQFDYEALREDQKLTYDVLKDSLNRELDVSQYYYLNTSYLGSFTGFQSQLPLYLDEYTFDRKSDVESYLNILKTSPDTFEQYAQLERERQAHDAGLSQAMLDAVIKQCETFAGAEDCFLIASFNQRIDAVDFLTEEEKASYKEQAQTLTSGSLQRAYAELAEELRTLDGSKETLGLAHRQDGKEYYAALIRYNVGIDDTPQELQEYLNRKYQETFLKMRAMMTKDDTLFPRALASPPPQVDRDSVEGVLDYLYTETAADFPPLPSLNYKISYVDPSMADSFSPAAYLISRVDTPLTDKESIILNGEFDPSLYTTLAHEGYPGHMYQTVYYKSLNPPIVRRLLTYTGYTEGWAVYVESFVTRYADGDRDVYEFLDSYNTLTNIYTAFMDLGIHYEGWDLDQFLSFVQEVLGPVDRDACVEMYNLIAELPTYYLYYYVGSMRFQDLYDRAKRELGDSFSNMAFHKAVLDAGPCPFFVLEQQVDNYIASAA